jgi:hypothetical protein
METIPLERAARGTLPALLAIALPVLSMPMMPVTGHGLLFFFAGRLSEPRRASSPPREARAPKRVRSPRPRAVARTLRPRLAS